MPITPPIAKNKNKFMPSFMPKPGVSTKDLAVFCRKLSYLLMAGVHIKTLLPTLSAGNNRALKKSLPTIHANVLSGDSFSTALAREGIFPKFMLGYVAIGEQTGQLAQCTQNLATFYERKANNRRELMAALMYPAMVMVIMLGVIILALLLVLPGYADIFATSNVPLPGITRGLIGLSSFMVAWGRVILLVVVCLLVLCVAVKNMPLGKKIASIMELKIGLMRQSMLVGFLQALSLLLGSGISLPDAMALVVDLVGNEKFAEDLLGVSVELSKGQRFSEGLGRVGLVEPLLVDMVAIGESTGDMAAAIAQAADYFTKEYHHHMTQAKKLIEPVLTIIMGALIGLIMLAVILPTFQLATAM